MANKEPQCREGDFGERVRRPKNAGVCVWGGGGVKENMPRKEREEKEKLHFSE